MAAPAVSASSAPLRILVAEDSATARLAIQHQLDALGYDCDVVSDGRAALEAWRRGGYAVVITDLHMPEIDGFALARAIRREEPGGRPRTTVIALTGDTDPADQSDCSDAGIDSWLEKPAERTALAATIKSALHHGGRGGATTVVTSALVGKRSHDPIDRATLAEMFGKDKTAQDDVLASFIDHAYPAAADLATAGLREPWRAAYLAHALKSSAAAVGASALAARCKSIEADAKAGNFERVRQDALEVTGLVDAITRWYEDQRPGSPDAAPAGEADDA